MGYLGGSIGSEQFAKVFIASRVQEWIRNVEALSEIAQCHPQAALAVLTRGLASKWTTAIFDVKVFNAHAPSNFTSSIATLH